MDNETIKQALEPLFTELNDKYQNVDDVITYLAEIEKNLEVGMSKAIGLLKAVSLLPD